MTIDELTQNYNNIELKEAYKAGFKECVQIVEQTIKNKNIMLSLRAILENKKVVVKTRNTNSPDMVIVKEEGKTQITLSQSFFDKSDLQNNRIMVAYEPGDHKVYFIVHNDENLYSDFMTGKRLAKKNEDGSDLLDENGKKVYSDEVGKKSRTFQDKKTSQDATLVETLEKVTILEDKTEFNLINLDPKSVIKEADEFAISSIYEVQNKKDAVVETMVLGEPYDSKLPIVGEITSQIVFMQETPSIVSEGETWDKINQTESVQEFVNTEFVEPATETEVVTEAEQVSYTEQTIPNVPSYYKDNNNTIIIPATELF